MRNILLEELKQMPVERQRIELVERKGTGQPDSMCDALVEQASVALCREYLKTFGRILPFNLDKGLLIPGRTEPRFGGGRVLGPMRLILGGHATAEHGGARFDVGETVQASVVDWLRQHIRFVDPERDIVLQNELKETVTDFANWDEHVSINATDTWAAVGYAPPTETERLVWATERYVNSPEFKEIHPEAGEDVKVMGCRRDRELTLSVALAFLDRFVADAQSYRDRKQEIKVELEKYLARRQQTLDKVTISINALDVPDRGEPGMYLTVLGTLAERWEGGQAGRGNRVNGLIALNRPMGIGAVAGKNPLSDFGKIYSVLTHRIAGRIYSTVSGLVEVVVRMCSQIGKPADDPLIASVQLILEEGVLLEQVAPAVEAVLERELANLDDFTARLARGEFPVW